MARTVDWLAFTVVLALPSGTLADTQIHGSARVRGSSPAISRAMELALEQSPTFRGLVAAINQTDGIVYVREGTCRLGLRGCLAGVHSAWPIRFVYITVDPRRSAGCELLATIGHELQHASEVLSDPKVIDNQSLAHFYLRTGATGDDARFETEAAVRVGLLVEKELVAGATCRR
jgi:hypothetical protein